MPARGLVEGSGEKPRGISSLGYRGSPPSHESSVEQAEEGTETLEGSPFQKAGAHVLVVWVGRQNKVYCDGFAEGRSVAATRAEGLWAVLPGLLGVRGMFCATLRQTLCFPGTGAVCVLPWSWQSERGALLSPACVLLPKQLTGCSLVPNSYREVAVWDRPCPCACSWGIARPASSGQPCLSWVGCPLGPAALPSSKERAHQQTRVSAEPQHPALSGQGRRWERRAAPRSRGTLYQQQFLPWAVQTLAFSSHKQIPRTASVGNEGVRQGCFQAISLPL